ncbi:MAG: isochorismatase family protein [Planctomycetales bacterium]|nr:isochorismatase family protein [Planctomycetales bacterium]
MSDIELRLRTRVATSPGADQHHVLVRRESWRPEETAVIVCDVWDLHHSQNAVRRATEFCPRLDALLSFARDRGMTVIHSPSDCMDAYQNHPARKRASEAPAAGNAPPEIAHWCSRIPAEEQAAYPIDQSDGGDDDDPKEHAQWAEHLRQLGRNVGTPWKAQTELLTIDADRDYITDRGDEVWNVLQQRGVKNVILTGVHTNMCVLGRPFGLRQMARNGMHVTLVRDLTDTMYNPARWPYVRHFAGTDLVIEHIERFVCPTITSDQLLGGDEFRFSGDRRPELAILIAEDEYDTRLTLPELARRWRDDFRITIIHGSEQERNDIPGLEALREADLLLLSVRRRTLPPEQLKVVRDFVAAGKPVLGIRTASHAFCLRNMPAPAGAADWPEFDQEVFGGNYTNHHGNQLKSQVTYADGNHPITKPLGMLPVGGVVQHGSLYMAAPLEPGATVLLRGELNPSAAAKQASPEPVAWTFQRRDGGRSFYTSIGAPLDLQNRFYADLLHSALRWAADIAGPAPAASRQPRPFVDDWDLTHVPLAELPPAAVAATRATLTGAESNHVWFRCAVRLTDHWVGRDGVTIELPLEHAAVWLNGAVAQHRDAKFLIPREAIDLDDANLLVVRLPINEPLSIAPRVQSAGRKRELTGRWQLRIGNGDWSNIPLPARYGASTDILFETTNDE